MKKGRKGKVVKARGKGSQEAIHGKMPHGIPRNSGSTKMSRKKKRRG